MKFVTHSNLTCPHCHFVQNLAMPTDACQFFYTCVNCDQTLKPKAGDCCVFCSYGDVPCPSMQVSEAVQMMKISQAVLQRDWDKPEEDEAWADL